MDTTKKGNELEDKIYELFLDQILNGRFWAKKECCKIYQKKGYYSKDRKKDIIFDIAIEIFLPNQKSFSSLVLIECKNYNKKVPVGDVETFLMKCQQVSGGNVKAIVVSNNAFQEGAFDFSESKRIGLLRYYDRDNLDWVLTRSPSNLVTSSYALNESATAYRGLNSSDYESKYFDFYGYVNYQYTNSIKLFFDGLIEYGQDECYVEALSLIKTTEDKSDSLVNYVEEIEIEKICEELLSEIDYSIGKVPLDELCVFLTKTYDLKVIETSELPDGVLGQISFDPLEILIQEGGENEAQKRFTLAHELGHFFLGHSKYMDGEKCNESSLDIDRTNEVGIKDIMRMEWQANQFASCLLLPKKQLAKSFLSIVERSELSNRGFGVLYLDNQQCNQDTYYRITTPLVKIYKVSRQAIKIRLKKLGFINESRKKGHGDEWKKELFRQ